MRRLLMLAILAAPLCASAEYLDVIQVKLKEKCTPATYVAIKNDFNEQWQEPRIPGGDCRAGAEQRSRHDVLDRP